jgi:2',3'-cyclic-nucleotide 2'-phosphodiesterase (5'-nucleotidase family)
MTRNLLALVLLSSVSLGLAGCDAKNAGTSADSGAAPRVALDSDAAKEKLGEDDGFDAVVFYGAELMGSIDDCGCPGHPQGGLPWRFGYSEGFRGRYADASTLQVDAGHSMADMITASGELYPDAVTKDDWVLKAFNDLRFDAVNLSHHEAYYLARYLKSDGSWDKAVAEYPVLARFVSANLAPARPDMIAPPPYVVREMAGKRLGETVRVAFVGVTETNPVLPQHTGLQVTDAADALAKVLPKARGEADLVVVLAYMATDAAQQLAQKVGGQVDAFIVSGPKARDTEPAVDAAPRMAYARYQTRQLGELRLFLNGKGLERVANRYVTLDDQLPKDPVAAGMAAEAKEAIKKAQIERFNNPTAGAPAQTPQPAAGGAAPPAGH